MVSVGTCLYVFGGKSSNEDVLFNDLHVFNTVHESWTEISLTTLNVTPGNIL